METIINKKGVERIILLLLLLCSLVIVCLIVLDKYPDIIFLLGFSILLSFIIGILLGYNSALKEIKDKIISQFNKDVKIPIKGSTLVSGSLIILVKDLKLKGILVESNFVEEGGGIEQIEKEILEDKKTFKVLIGDEEILKNGSKSVPK